MSDISKKFIQRMMGRQALSENDTLIMYSQICQDITGDGVIITLDDLTKAIKNMNENLQLCNMNIRKTICETTGQTYYVLICNVNNTFAKGFSFYTKTERELYRKIVEEIIMCEEGAVSSTICVNLNTSLPTNITKSDAERLIKKLVGEKWLDNQKGSISLGVRTLAEMEPYLTSVYKDYIKKCTLCHNIVILGSRCQGCDTLFHYYCMNKYFNQSGSQRRCPTCKVDWQETMDLEEENIFEVDTD